ncbi:MAG: PAS domain-containing protein [Polyangiaceae bacterium]|nr:PAS domain-containing protein [Polyangiaceae bacterium]
MSRTPKSKVLDARQAAALLGEHVETLRRMARQGEIPSIKQGRAWRFREAALLRWSEKAQRRTQNPAKPLGRGVTPPARSARRLPGEARAVPPIVGIGASAGGLEALDLFLRNVPEKCGLCFVVVQHLDPTRKGMMVELLQRATPMRVLQVKDRVRVAPDRIYVIPPNKDLAILAGVLHLLAPTAQRGMRLPIDFFFRSLAEDQRSRSVGVVLSGMGSDGTQGLRAIKERGGAGFVQEPATARFEAMPRSAIDAGLADVVAPAEELPRRLLSHCLHAPSVAGSDVVLSASIQRDIDRICVLLRSQTGHDFSGYKRSTLYRRIERRMGLHQLATLAGYVPYLQENPQEALLLFKELLIGVTSFFRDPEDWEQLKQVALPELLAARASNGALRAWVPGCATGEEAYSLAIVLKEAIAQLRPDRGIAVQVFATDLDKDAIERARAGVYPPGIAENVSAERRRRFFVEEAGGFRLCQEIRKMVVFAVQNMIMDPPFTKLDILSCRNLLIYLAPDLQRKLVPLFHYSLNPHGVLFLGGAETIGTAADLFAPVGEHHRIYRRLPDRQRSEPVDFPVTAYARSSATSPRGPRDVPGNNLKALADRFILERYAPAAVLTNDQGDILYVSGRTGTFLEPAAGKANWNIHAMARDGLRYELIRGFQKAVRERRPISHRQVQLDGASRVVEVTIEPLQEPEGLRGMVAVLFAEVPVPRVPEPAGKNRKTPTSVAKLDQELRRARDEVQTTREEMQTSREELTSANEELQSTNEELQSTNEELTTSKEELQSMNEELQTLNHELEAKLEDLKRAGDDMKNLLDSTDIATLFLDDALRVRRFTTQMATLVKLIPGDIGRPITDLASALVYSELAADARDVLKTLAFKETPVVTGDGRRFSARIMPYRTTDNRIDGVVITFVAIADRHPIEATRWCERPGPPGSQ